jgi:arsenite methyltransferase
MTERLSTPRSVSTAKTWKIRPAEGSDLASVRALLALSHLPWDGLMDQFGDAYAVAEADGHVVGVAGLETYGGHGLLRSVAVAPEWRLCGVAEALVKNRIQWAGERGLQSVHLLTTDAARYFDRLGFRALNREEAPTPIRESREYASICPQNARLMRYVAAGVPQAEECCGGGSACNDDKVAENLDTPEGIRNVVRERYAEAARRVSRQGSTSCCGGGGADAGPITSNLYTIDETTGLPEAAVLASLGCGNPTLLAELREGETVLDLGSGGGIDVLLSAKRVGPSGFAYGIDMTDEMLSLARENQRKAGVGNVEFRKGEIEALPISDGSVDVIISNCVINLSADKRRVLQEAFRVLKPGGRFAVSDIVVRREVPAEIRRSAELWSGCVAGALEEWTYRGLLEEAGFVDVEVVPTRIYSRDDARAIAIGSAIGEDVLDAVDGAFMSAFVRATKPAV